MNEISYSVVPPSDVDVHELASFYERQKHQTTRSLEKLREMLERSQCFVAARDLSGQLIGIARGITDGVRGYLAECKLDPSLQGPAAVTRVDGRIEHDEQGIARMMAVHVLSALSDAGVERVHVIAHGTEEDFLSELGFTRAAGMISMQVDTASLASIHTETRSPVMSEAKQ